MSIPRSQLCQIFYDFYGQHNFVGDYIDRTLVDTEFYVHNLTNGPIKRL